MTHGGPPLWRRFSEHGACGDDLLSGRRSAGGGDFVPRPLLAHTLRRAARLRARARPARAAQETSFPGSWGRFPARRARPERGRRSQGCRAAGVRHGRRRARRADLGRERDDGLRALGLPGGLGQRGLPALSAWQAARLRARARSRRAHRLRFRALARRPGGHRDEQRDRGGARSRGVRDGRPRCTRAARASLTLALLAFTFLYRFVPPVAMRVRDVVPGAIVAPSACIWRARASRSTSPASAASTTSSGRSAPCSRSCCWSTPQPPFCSWARALSLPGRKPRRSPGRRSGEPVSLRSRLVRAARGLVVRDRS